MTGGWKRFTVKGVAPDEAHYAVPAVYFTNRTASPGVFERLPLDVNSARHVHSANKISFGSTLTVADGIHSHSATRLAKQADVSPNMWITEAAFYQLTTPPPPPGLERLLRIGDSSMRLGLPITTPPVTTPPIPSPYLGYVLGEPPTQ